MTCREVTDFLLDFLSGELQPDARVRFERHLSVCPNCRAYLATYQATIELGRQAFAAPDADSRTEMPEELVSAILDVLRR